MVSFLSTLKRSVKVAIVLVVLTIILGLQFIQTTHNVAEAGPPPPQKPVDCICDDFNYAGWWHSK